MNTPFFAFLLFLSPMYSQNLLGTWLLKEQYNKNELVISTPYLKYEFSVPNHWKSYVKPGLNKGKFDYIDSGYFLTDGHKIELLFKDGGVSKGVYSIKGDSLLVIELYHSEGTSKMVFKRLPKQPES